MLLRAIKEIFHEDLRELYPKEEVDSFFYRMLEHYLSLKRFVLVLQPQLSLTKEEEQPLFEGLARLKQEEPLQYILGEAHFMDLTLKVNRHVLIPRPETEGLVQWIISEFSMLNSEFRILDIGTGSGCIAIALAKAFPQAIVYALDVSKEALNLAQQNASLSQVKVEFLHADILNLNLELEFDCIVSNPPYVRELEKAEIKSNVKRYEPQQALFVPDENPLKFYKAIAAFANQYLKKGGQLYFEINQYLAEDTKHVLLDSNFKDVELKRDIFGNFRMLRGVLPNSNFS